MQNKDRLHLLFLRLLASANLFKWLFVGLVLFYSGKTAFAVKITGRVLETSQKQPVSFCGVYIKGTTKGTNANSDGYYTLDAPASTSVTLVYQAVGFKTTETLVKINLADVNVNMELSEEGTKVSEVEIKFNRDAEDPAYPIMRKAIKKRKFYQQQVDAFSCKAYIKGINNLTEIPKWLYSLGGTKPTAKDSADNLGIVYLSESVSDYYFQKPGNEKEVMIGSKVSGNPRGFSFNNYRSMQFSLYDPVVNLGQITMRGLVSPLAPNATLYYRFRLDQTIEDNGVTVYKIRCQPRHNNDPAYSGYVYVQDSTWRLHAFDVYATKDAGVQYVDTLHFSSSYIMVSDKVWMPSSNLLKFNFNFLGVKGGGYFLASLTDYNLAPVYTPRFFNNEVMKVTAESNKQDTSFWRAYRAVPLTLAESKDYTSKDSIAQKRESKPYLDSVDKENNAFKATALIFGYTYFSRYKQNTFNYTGLAETVQYNTVEGLALMPNISFRHFDKDTRQSYGFNQDVRYGFTSKRFYAESEFFIANRPKLFERLSIKGGNMIKQVNGDNPLLPWLNSAYTLIDRVNYARLYEKAFGAISYGREVYNGVQLAGNLSAERRVPLDNRADYSFRPTAERAFMPNVVDLAGNRSQLFEAHNALVFQLNASIKPAQKYVTRPNGKFYTSNKYPTININYRKGIPTLINSQVNYDFLRVASNYDWDVGLLGSSEASVAIGGFINAANVQIQDYAHFLGNQTLYGSNKLNQFQLLPYYALSTKGRYFEGHFQHNFGGFFLNKIPLLRKLKFQEIAGVHYLQTSDRPGYAELVLGIGNIFKIIRIDYVRAITNAPPGNVEGVRLRVGLGG